MCLVSAIYNSERSLCLMETSTRHKPNPIIPVYNYQG